MRQLVYYVAASVDGFIADPTGDTSAFPVDPDTLTTLFDRYPETCPAHLREPLGVAAEPRRFDTVIMGYRTYEPAVLAGLPGGAYPQLRQIVATSRSLPDAGAVETVTGDVAALVARLKKEPGRDLWLCGGADLAGQLVDEIDEVQVKINPVLLGRGLPLFGGAVAPRPLALVDSTPLAGGVVLTTHRRA